MFQKVFKNVCLSISAAQSKEFIFESAKLSLNLFATFFEVFSFQKKRVSYLCRTATTAYPCCLPTLGGFSRSWSHRTYPAAKVEIFNLPPNKILISRNFMIYLNTDKVKSPVKIFCIFNVKFIQNPHYIYNFG